MAEVSKEIFKTQLALPNYYMNILYNLYHAILCVYSSIELGKS